MQAFFDYLLFIVNWFMTNKEELLAFLLTVGVVLEALNAAFPTKTKDSFLEKVGRFITAITSKLPSRAKKVEATKPVIVSDEKVMKTDKAS